MKTLRSIRDEIDAPISATELLDDLQQSLRGLGIAGLGVVLLVLALRLHATHAGGGTFVLAPGRDDAPDAVQAFLDVAMNLGLGCFVIPALLIYIGWELWESRLGLQGRERACAQRRRAGLPGRVARRLVCGLVTVTKWITIAVSVLLLAASVLLVVACVAGLVLSSVG